MEQEADLVTYLTVWLSRELDTEEDPPLLLTQAYRIGRANNPLKPFPRDVIITFANAHMQKRVFDFAREKGGITHDKDTIQVFLDLALEALAKRRELKEIIAILQDAHIRLRWAGPLKIQVFNKNQSYFIFNEETGLEVLHLLHLPKPPRPDRTSTKWKLNLAISPNKDSLKFTKMGITT